MTKKFEIFVPLDWNDNVGQQVLYWSLDQWGKTRIPSPGLLINDQVLPYQMMLMRNFCIL